MKITTEHHTPFALWIVAMQVEGMAANTITRRTGTIRRFQKHLGHGAESASLHDITVWLAKYRHPTTRLMYMGDIDAYYRWLRNTGRLEINVVADMKRPRQKVTRPRPAPTDKLFHLMQTAPQWISDLLHLGAYEGLRISEAIAVKGEDIQDGMLYLTGKGDQDAALPVHDLVQEIADRMPKTGYWFPGQKPGTHVSRRSASEHIAEIFSGAGINGNFHMCRHWCCTNLIRSGATIREAQEFMRHASISTTARYAAVTQQELTTAAARLPVPVRIQHPMAA